MASDAEVEAMRQAIVLSALGLGTASPNPPVGCVILDSYGRVAGTGFHRRKGEAHAEVNALHAAGAAARGGTAVVTLEPCNHVGVTPACRQALLDARIARVVIGVSDPTSRGDGGAAVLAAAGIDVESGVLPGEVLTVLGPWLAATIRRTPHITLAYTADADREAETDASLVHTLRSSVDVIVTGDQIAEGIADGHSVRHFRLNDLRPPGSEPIAWLSEAFTVGVRTVLLFGQSRIAESVIGADAIDRLILAVPRRSENLDISGPIALALPGYEIAALSAWSGGLLTQFQRTTTAPIS